MNWTSLKPSPRSHAGAEVRFTIRPQSNSRSVRLVLSVRPDIAKAAGFLAGDKLTLQHGKDEKTGKALGRMVDVAGPGSQHYRTENNARGTVEYSCSGEVREAWSDNVSPMTDLEFISVKRGEIIFSMPEWEENS